MKSLSKAILLVGLLLASSFQITKAATNPEIEKKQSITKFLKDYEESMKELNQTLKGFPVLFQ
ncbi:MAG: hypothetical protein HC912_00055 [Saprospiraceae bacterium]|nr:hypothetical protein [Saprospiraceae bacterium]